MCFIKSNNNKVSTTGQIEDTCDPTTHKQPLKTTAYYKSGAVCHPEYNVSYITWQSWPLFMFLWISSKYILQIEMTVHSIVEPFFTKKYNHEYFVFNIFNQLYYF